MVIITTWLPLSLSFRLALIFIFTFCFQCTAGCGECFLWPYCHSLFHQRFIPSYYPSQLEDLDSTTSAATTTTTNAELDVIKNTDYSGDELMIIRAVAAAVAEMADPSSHCETEKTLAFFYTLLACIRVLKSKAVSRTPSSSSEAQWRSEDVESLSLNCQRFVYMTKRRRLSDEYVEQVRSPCHHQKKTS